MFAAFLHVLPYVLGGALVVFVLYASGKASRCVRTGRVTARRH
jgi:hypothetical protein